MKRVIALTLAAALAVSGCSGSSDSCPEGEDYVVIFPLTEGSTTQLDFEINWTSRTDVVGEPIVASVDGPFRNDEPSFPPMAADVGVFFLLDDAWAAGALPTAGDERRLEPFDEFRGFYRYEIAPFEGGMARVQLRPGFATTPPDCETSFGDMTADVVQLSLSQEGTKLVEISRVETAFWWEVEFGFAGG